MLHPEIKRVGKEILIQIFINEELWCKWETFLRIIINVTMAN